MDEQVDGCGRGDCRDGGRGGGIGFSVSDHLRTTISLGFSGCLGRSAFIGTMTLLAAAEAESFSNTSGTVGRGEFSKAYSIYIHGIGVSGGG